MPKNNQVEQKDKVSDVRIPKNLRTRREQQRKALTQALQPSERERQTRQTIQNLESSEAMGIADVKDQPIAMPFIRGQAAGIQRQTQAKMEPLQDRLARLQQERQQQQNVAQTQLGFTQEDIQTTRQEQIRQDKIAREREEREEESLRERQQRIREIAEDARQRGASREAIDAIMAAEDTNQALQAAASVAPVQPEADERFETRSISGGGILELEKDSQTGEIVNQQVIRQPDSGGEGTTDEIVVESGGLQYSRRDLQEDAAALEQSRGQDGYVDPTVYQNLYQAWLQSGGNAEDFKDQFPPEAYVNPANTWLPAFLMPEQNDSGRSVR